MSARKPTSRLSFERTRGITTASFSRPWNPSTAVTRDHTCECKFSGGSGEEEHDIHTGAYFNFELVLECGAQQLDLSVVRRDHRDLSPDVRPGSIVRKQ